MLRLDRVRWPLAVRLEPSDESLLDRADRVFAYTARLAAPPGDVLAALFDTNLALPVPALCGVRWHGAQEFVEGARYDEHFAYMTLALRVVRAEERVVVVSVDGCTWPLGRRMVQVGRAEPLPGGGCVLDWRIGVELIPWTRPAAPLVFPTFEPTFRATVRSLERRFGVA